EAACGIGRRRAQQIGEPAGGTGIEGGVGAAGKSGDILETGRRLAVAALVEDEALYAEQAKLPGEAAQFIGLFLHAVADIDEGPDRRLGSFGAEDRKSTRLNSSHT